MTNTADRTPSSGESPGVLFPAQDLCPLKCECSVCETIRSSLLADPPQEARIDVKTDGEAAQAHCRAVCTKYNLDKNSRIRFAHIKTIKRSATISIMVLRCKPSGTEQRPSFVEPSIFVRHDFTSPLQSINVDYQTTVAEVKMRAKSDFLYYFPQLDSLQEIKAPSLDFSCLSLSGHETDKILGHVPSGAILETNANPHLELALEGFYRAYRLKNRSLEFAVAYDQVKYDIGHVSWDPTNGIGHKQVVDEFCSRIRRLSKQKESASISDFGKEILVEGLFSLALLMHTDFITNNVTQSYIDFLDFAWPRGPPKRSHKTTTNASTQAQPSPPRAAIKLFTEKKTPAGIALALFAEYPPDRCPSYNHFVLAPLLFASQNAPLNINRKVLTMALFNTGYVRAVTRTKNEKKRMVVKLGKNGQAPMRIRQCQNIMKNHIFFSYLHTAVQELSTVGLKVELTLTGSAASSEVSKILGAFAEIPCTINEQVKGDGFALLSYGHPLITASIIDFQGETQHNKSYNSYDCDRHVDLLYRVQRGDDVTVWLEDGKKQAKESAMIGHCHGMVIVENIIQLAQVICYSFVAAANLSGMLPAMPTVDSVTVVEREVSLLVKELCSSEKSSDMLGNVVVMYASSGTGPSALGQNVWVPFSVLSAFAAASLAVQGMAAVGLCLGECPPNSTVFPDHDPTSVAASISDIAEMNNSSNMKNQQTNCSSAKLVPSESACELNFDVCKALGFSPSSENVTGIVEKPGSSTFSKSVKRCRQKTSPEPTIAETVDSIYTEKPRKMGPIAVNDIDKRNTELASKPTCANEYLAPYNADKMVVDSEVILDWPPTGLSSSHSHGSGVQPFGPAEELQANVQRSPNSSSSTPPMLQKSESLKVRSTVRKVARYKAYKSCSFPKVTNSQETKSTCLLESDNKHQQPLVDSHPSGCQCGQSLDCTMTVE